MSWRGAARRGAGNRDACGGGDGAVERKKGGMDLAGNCERERGGGSRRGRGKIGDEVMFDDVDRRSEDI